MRKIASLLLRLLGWKITGTPPTEKKFVCIVAPHTSWWDFFFGRMGLWVLGIKAHFLIKQEFFVWPIRRLLRGMGGIPVNRQQAQNMVSYCVSVFAEEEALCLVITPEGTRSYTEKWKKGFYYIALRAQVPLYVGYLDYQKKEVGMVCSFPISGDIEVDFPKIQELLKGHKAKFPEKYNLDESYLNKIS